ncbi:hypothetical protein ATCC90586_000653 [Pythium insidiosum]|nr:hypothetical protein ATCC90586_000653 [Pythium insidiosum]
MGNSSTRHLLDVPLVAQPKHRPLVALPGTRARCESTVLRIDEPKWTGHSVVRDVKTSTELYWMNLVGLSLTLELLTPPGDRVVCVQPATLQSLYRVKLSKDSDDVLFTVHYDEKEITSELVNVALNRMARVVIECVASWQDDVAIVSLERESGEREPIARFRDKTPSDSASIEIAAGVDERLIVILWHTALIAQPKHRALVAFHGARVRSEPSTLRVEEATWSSDTVVRDSQTSSELYRASRDGFGGPLVLTTPPNDRVLCIEAAILDWLYRVKLSKDSDDVLFSVKYDSSKFEVDLVNVSLNRMARVVVECVSSWQDDVAIVTLESESGKREPIARFRNATGADEATIEVAPGVDELLIVALWHIRREIAIAEQNQDGGD